MKNTCQPCSSPLSARSPAGHLVVCGSALGRRARDSDVDDNVHYSIGEIGAITRMGRLHSICNIRIPYIDFERSNLTFTYVV
jgi:hypothetical protein